MARPELSCSVGCNKLKIALILNGAKGKALPGWSQPKRDAVVAECMATIPPTEMDRFEGLAPDATPETFRPSDKIYMLDMLYYKPCVAPESREIVRSYSEQFMNSQKWSA